MGTNTIWKLTDLTEPTVKFITEVAKQHDVSSCTIAGTAIFAVLVSVWPIFWSDNNNRKIFDCFNVYLPKMALVPLTDWPDVFERKAPVFQPQTNVRCVIVYVCIVYFVYFVSLGKWVSLMQLKSRHIQECFLLPRKVWTVEKLNFYFLFLTNF